MQQHQWTWCISLLLLSALLSACGGGSGATSNGPGSNDNGGQSQGPINGELKGYLFIADDNAYIDLATGEEVSLELDSVDNLVLPASDGVEYVTTIEDYRFLPGLGPDLDAIVIKNMLDGRVEDVFELSNSVVGSARLSLDRQVVAAIWRDESSGEDFDEDRLTLFARDGTVLSRSPQQDIGSFDWIGDGRLVYTVGNSIYITLQSHDVSETSLLYQFDSALGKPAQLSVSPDDTRLVFELSTGGSPSPFVDWRDATVWMMNIDGSGLRMLATTEDEDPRVNSTVWSPDSNWVATVEGYIGGITAVYDVFEPGEWRWEVLQGVPGVLYALPADGENLVLPGDGSTGVRPLIESSSAGNYNLIRPGFSPKMEWLATIPIAGEARGSLPVSDATNGGMQGRLYFDEDGEGDTTAMHAVDLQNGTDQTLFKLTDDDLDNVSDLVYASRDSQYFSHHYSDVSNDAIYILDQNGQMLTGILTEGSNYDMGISAPVRFSPRDPDLILVSYYDVYDYSNSYLDDVVSIIDWRTRTFVMDYDSREYLAADWTPDGDVLLAGRDGNLYLAAVDGRNFADPVLHFPTQDEIITLAVSPDGSQIAYTLNRHIWVSDFDGRNFRRLTGFSEGFNMFPEWSPDSKYIAFKHVDDNDGPTDFGDIWVVAADAESVLIRGDRNTPNAIGLWAGETRLDPFGSFAWR